MTRNGERGTFAVLAVGFLLLAAFTVLISPGIEAGGSRSEGEDVRIDITVDFTGITEMTGGIRIELNRIRINGTLMSADEIRSTYETDENITLDVDAEVMERIDYTIGTILAGDEPVIGEKQLHQDTLVNSTENLGKPIIYTMTVTAVTPGEAILPESRLNSIGEGRLDYVLASLMLCGFTYERTVNITAEEGEIVTIHLSDEIDPFGDGSVNLPVGSGWPKDSEGYYTLTVDGLQSELSKAFSFSIPSSHRLVPGSESYTGNVEIDWFALNSMGMAGTVDIESIDIRGRNIFSGIPDSVDVPNFVPASLIRELYLEGVLDDNDLVEISAESSDRVEEEITASMDIDSLSISADIDTRTEGVPLPDDGSSLLEIIDSDLGILIDIETIDPVDLDILDGYEEEDVMGLLNGGLRILKNINGIEDDDIEVALVLPSGLYFGDETPLGNESGRYRYELIPGLKSIRSNRAPQYSSENIDVDAFIDLSRIESHYISDAVLDMNAEMTLFIDHLEFDPDDYPMDTTLNYSLDYLNADLIRLLVGMEIIEESVIGDEITDRVSTMLEDFIPREEQIIDITFREGTMTFDGDHVNVNGEDPIVVDISITSNINPFESDLLGMMGGDLDNSFLPFHTDPILPVKTVQRTFHLGEAMDWNLNLSIRFPSGTGVNAWLGSGTDHYKQKLETRVEDGYPTLYLDLDSGDGDHIYIEMEFGSYFAVNNFTVCFASVWIVLLVIVLMILVSIVKKIRKKTKKDGKGEEEAEDAETDGDPGESEENTGNWN